MKESPAGRSPARFDFRLALGILLALGLCLGAVGCQKGPEGNPEADSGTGRTVPAPAAPSQPDTSGNRVSSESGQQSASASGGEDSASGDEDSPRLAPTAGLPRLLDLGAGKCIPCKMMAPILEELREEYQGKMEVFFLDVWENPQWANQYGIETIPTQIFYGPSGKELYRHEGFFSKEDILTKWEELGIQLQKDTL